MAEKKKAVSSKVKASKSRSSKPAGEKLKANARLSCQECGLIVTVDEACGCIDVCDLICCGEEMTQTRNKVNLHDEIAKVAYELWEKSGRISRDVESWLEAEKIVMTKYAKKEVAIAAKQVRQVVEATGKKIKETVMKTQQKEELKKNKL